MATGMYFVITDGTTTCTFADGADPPGSNNYAISSEAWAPAVAGLLTSQLGGRGPYADVVETIPINILGSTVPNLLANAQTLERLIQQSERWARGDNVAPVLVKYSPRGATASSAAAPLQAVILGRDPSASGQANAPSAVTLPATFDLEVGQRIIADGTLTFLRRGAWLLSTPVTGTSASIANPGPYPITGMTTHPNLSPCKVTLAGFTATSTWDYSDCSPIILLAQQSSDLQLVNAGSATASGFTTVNDSANLAQGTNILRFTPVGTSEQQSGEISMASMTSGTRRFALFAAVRNNSASTIFTIRVASMIRSNTTGPVNAIYNFTRPVIIDTASYSKPRYIPLGIFVTSMKLEAIKLAVTASAAAGTLDINYIVALAIDNPCSRAIQLVGNESSNTYFTNAVLSDIIVDPKALTGISPEIWRAFEGTNDIDFPGYSGDAYPVTLGTTFVAAIMCHRYGAPYNAFWTYGSVSAISLTATCARQNAYLTPE